MEKWNAAGLRLDVLLVLAICGFALIVRLVSLGQLPMHFDEWFHVLTAQSYAQDGSFAFINGEYTRAPIFTAIIAGVIQFLPFEPMIAARMSSIIFGVLSIGVFYVLARRLAGREVALISAGLLCVDQLVVHWSVYTRFYSLQMLCVLLVILIAETTFARGRRRWPAMVLPTLVIVALSLLAFSIQITSFIAIGGYAAFKILKWQALWEFARGHRALSILAVIAAAITGAVGLYVVGPKMWEILRFADTWALPYQDDWFYYVTRMQAAYLLFWPLTIIAIIVGLRVNLYATLLCLSIIVPVLVVHSIGGMKALRYILPAIPFLTLLWAITLKEIAVALFSWLTRRFSSLQQTGERGRLASSLAAALVAVVLAAGVFANSGYRHGSSEAARNGLAMLKNPASVTQEPVEEAWLRESERLAGVIEPGGFVVTSAHQKLTYFVERPDARLMTQVSYNGEYLAYDGKTGLLQIGQRAELDVVMSCQPAGTIIVPLYTIANSSDFTELAAYLDKVALRENGLEYFAVWQWQSDMATPDASCSDLPNEVVAAR